MDAQKFRAHALHWSMGAEKTYLIVSRQKENLNNRLLRSLPAQHCDIDKQHNIHHQGIDDGRNSDSVIIEYKRAGGHGYRLGCILHAHLNDHSTALASRQSEEARQESCTGCGAEQQCCHTDTNHADIVGYGAAVLYKKDAGQQYQCWKGKPGEHTFNLKCCPWPPMPDANTYNNRQEHQQQILHQQIAYGQ